jgi:putative integral membrane protein (TIGR02587 family)
VSSDPSSPPGTGRDEKARNIDREFLVGLARAFGGAIVFSLPILMTMEMWHLGFHMDRWRLALFLALTVPLLVGLSAISGFRKTRTLLDNVVDAFVALAVGFITSAVSLYLFGIMEWGSSLDEAIGKVALQLAPTSIGALLAQSQFGQDRGEQEEKELGTYHGELLLLAVGALFLSLPVAATEEMILIAYRMTPWQQLALIATSLGIMHAFVYAMQFQGQESVTPGASLWQVFLRFTIVGYAIALVVSAYVLWSFGRLEPPISAASLVSIIVLAFPGSVGAAAARVLL